MEMFAGTVGVSLASCGLVPRHWMGTVNTRPEAINRVQYLHGPDPVELLVLRKLPVFLANLGDHTRVIVVAAGGDGKGERAQKQEGGEQVGEH